MKTDVENVIGGDGNDALLGGAAANVLTGGPGQDSLDGDTGNDRSTAAPAPTVHRRRGHRHGHLREPRARP